MKSVLHVVDIQQMLTIVFPLQSSTFLIHLTIRVFFVKMLHISTPAMYSHF